MTNVILACIMDTSPLQDRRDAPYINFNSSSHTWYCILCSAGPMQAYKTVKSHRNGANHKKEFAILHKAHRANVEVERLRIRAEQLTTCTDWCRSTQISVDMLPSRLWQRHMKQLFYEYTCSCENGPEVNELIQGGIRSTLSMYQARKKLVLLELAVWKNQCIVAHAEETSSDPCNVSMQTILDYWALDELFDPIHFRQTVRTQSGKASLIEECVLPFLGPAF